MSCSHHFSSCRYFLNENDCFFVAVTFNFIVKVDNEVKTSEFTIKCETCDENNGQLENCADVTCVSFVNVVLYLRNTSAYQYSNLFQTDGVDIGKSIYVKSVVETETTNKNYVPISITNPVKLTAGTDNVKYEWTTTATCMCRYNTNNF